MSRHHTYSFPGHAGAFAEACRAEGREDVTPGQVTPLEPFRKATAALSAASNRRDLTAAQAHDIADVADRQLAVLEVATETLRRMIADARAGLGDREATPDDPAPPEAGPFPPKQPAPPDEFPSGEKQPLESQLEDKHPEPTLYPNGPPTPEILADHPSGDDIQHAAGDPITTDTTPGKDDEDDRGEDEPKGKRKKGK